MSDYTVSVANQNGASVSVSSPVAINVTTPTIQAVTVSTAATQGLPGPQGIQGIQGEKGDKGDTGNTGGVWTVNTMTGDVVLGASDVHALPDSTEYVAPTELINYIKVTDYIDGGTFN